MKPEVVHDVVKGAAVGGAVAVPTGGLSGPVLMASGAGFAVALVSRAYESWSKARKAATQGPLRYLTQLEDQGVSFSVSR
jgi:hypothetical protein